nr:aldehyde dehydrogenase family 3 member F1-like [Ipomoea batatas]
MKILSSANEGLALEPIIGAIAAGCVAVLKPSEQAPACSSVIAKSISAYLDPKAFKVIEGGSLVSERLLEHKWDKIFFTGSAAVGRLIMTAAAKHLTPVTLELGGKCPAIVDSLSSSWDKDVALKRILAGKFGTCSGQACIVIDYILVERKFSSELVQLLTKYIQTVFGDNPKQTHSVARIVSKKHFTRLKSLLDEPKVKASLVYGGLMDEDNLFIEPTLLVDPPLNAAVMTEEIFGPILPIITVRIDFLLTYKCSSTVFYGNICIKSLYCCSGSWRK